MEEKTLNKFNAQIECYECALKVLTAFKDAAKPFDGKVYNKRLREALDKAAKAIYPRAYVHEGCESMGWQKPNYIYLGVSIYHIAFDKDDEDFDIGRWSNDEKYIVYNDKRFDYTAFCNEVDKKIEIVAKRKAEYARAIEIFDDAKKRFKEISDEWKQFANSLPTPIRPYIRAYDDRNYFGSFGL
jgi:hypothetical protein